MTNITNNLFKLTREEFDFFGYHNTLFFGKYGLDEKIPISNRIASSLHTLAVYKLLGLAGFKKNKEQAIRHHLKACRRCPEIAFNRPKFRKEVGLIVYEPCEK